MLYPCVLFNCSDHESALTRWQNPPTRTQIQEALKIFDVDGNGVLDKWVTVLFACGST